MRSRSLAIASASLALTLFAAGCGEDDPIVASTPETPAGSSAPSPSPETTPDPVGSSPTDLPTASSPGVNSPQADAAKNKRTITATIAANTDLQSLKTALGAADLSSVLAQPGPYTIFAPSNDAFSKIGSRLDTLLQPASKQELAALLQFHVVSGRYRIKSLKDGQLLTTLQGTRLRVSKDGDQIAIGNSEAKGMIVAADTPATNGVIQTIDTVLTPKKPK